MVRVIFYQLFPVLWIVGCVDTDVGCASRLTRPALYYLFRRKPSTLHYTYDCLPPEPCVAAHVFPSLLTYTEGRDNRPSKLCLSWIYMVKWLSGFGKCFGTTTDGITSSDESFSDDVFSLDISSLFINDMVNHNVISLGCTVCGLVMSLLEISIVSYYYFENTVQHRCSQTRTYTHSYERTHTLPLWAPLKDWAGKSWGWRSHHRCLAVDGHTTYHWKNSAG
jgi:hypothetical protein